MGFHFQVISFLFSQERIAVVKHALVGLPFGTFGNRPLISLFNFS